VRGKDQTEAAGFSPSAALGIKKPALQRPNSKKHRANLKVCAIVPLGAGVELEGGPVEGAAVGSFRVQEIQLGVAQRGGWILSRSNTLIEVVHDLGSGRSADFPKASTQGSIPELSRYLIGQRL